MSTRKERAKETKKRILQKAVELFSNQGYSSTTVDQIAEAAKVAKGSVFSHFGSKDALALAIIEEISDSYVKSLEIALEINEMSVENLISQSLDQMESGLGITQILFSLYLDKMATVDQSEIELHSRQYLEPVYEKMALIFKKIGFRNPKIITRIFFAILDGIALQLSLEGRWADTQLISELFTSVKSLLASGIRK